MRKVKLFNTKIKGFLRVRPAGKVLVIFVGWGLGMSIFCLPGAAFGLNSKRDVNQYLVEQYTMEDGLPQHSVLRICQTRDGYLWLGTYQKLVRFDGIHFKVFDKSNTPEMNSNSINALFRDNDGTLWIGTPNGLFHHCRGTFKKYSQKDGLCGCFVLSIYRDGSGALWVGTKNGLNRFENGKNGENGVFTSYTTSDGLYHNSILDIVDDKEGNLWMITGPKGLDRFHNGKFTHYTTRDGLPDNELITLYKSKDGQVWIGTHRGLVVLKNGQLERFPASAPDMLAKEEIRAIYQDASGSIWIGTRRNGLYCFRNDSFYHLSFKEDDLNPSVWALFEDRERSLWVGTSAGLFQLKDGKYITYNRENGLAAKAIRSIMEDKQGNIWIGSGSQGLIRFKDGIFQRIALNQKLQRAGIYAITQARDGAIWLGTYRQGLHRLKNSEITSYTTLNGLSNNTVRAVYVDSRDWVWAGTNGGGVDIIINGKKAKNYSTKNGLSDDYIYAITGDKTGAIWIGTYSGGINRFKDGKFTLWAHQQQHSGNITWALYPDNQTTLWIGTNGAGLRRLKNGKITCFTAADGLYSDLAFQVLEDRKGNLWMNCNKGISCVSKNQLNRFAEGKITRIQPLVVNPSKEISKMAGTGPAQPAGWRTKDGKLWFPTISGIAVIDPENIPVNQIPPPVVIEKIMVDGKEKDLTTFPKNQTMVLSPGKKRLQFQYTGLSFIDPQRVRFKIKLEGYDEDWLKVGTERKFTYMNIEPGTYRFRVIACNSDGIWNETGASFSFLLTPCFSQTGWFYGICILCLLLVGLGLHWLRARQILSKERKKYEKVLLPSEYAEEYLKKLLHLMESEKTYLDPDICLQGLSKRLVIPEHYLSQVMNGRLNRNFYDFINHYRIEEAKRILSNSRNHLTILEVAFEVGFNSKSTFNRAFKKHTQMTPSDFKKEQLGLKKEKSTSFNPSLATP